MEDFVLGIKIGGILILIVGGFFSLIFLVYTLAKFNIFFTVVQEGTAKAIKKFGKFQRMVMVYEKHALDQKGIVRHLDENEKEGTELVKKADGTIQAEKYTIEIQPQPLRLWGGLRWVGIPFIYSVHKYEFRWISYEQGEKDGKLPEKIISHAERIDYILLQDDVYYSFVHGAETKGMVPVDVDLLLTIRITNPYKAMFRVQNWLEAILNQVKPAFRRFIASQPFEKLIEKEEKMEREVDEFLKESGIADYAERDYGARLKKVGMAKVDPAGERGKIYTEAASKQYEAEQEKKRVITLADADVERMGKVYGKIREFGEDGLAIRMLESIDKAGEKQGNWIIPWGSVQDILKSLIGKGGKS